MSYEYKKLKSLPDDLSLGVLLKFLAKTKNSRLRPADADSDCPPIFFWWFDKEDEEVSNFIADAVKSFKWRDEWTLEAKGGGKWLLFPEHIRDGERIVKGVGENENVEVTDDGIGWLMRNEPEFGRRANQDLDEFRKYFRVLVEKYLKNKE